MDDIINLICGFLKTITILEIFTNKSTGILSLERDKEIEIDHWHKVFSDVRFRTRGNGMKSSKRCKKKNMADAAVHWQLTARDVLHIEAGKRVANVP